MITHEITLEMRKEASPRMPRVTVREGEGGTERIAASVELDGEAYESGCPYARLDILHADGTWARVAAEKSGSTVAVTLPSAALSGPGMCRLAHFVFYGADADGAGDVEKTSGFELLILPGVDASGAEAQDYDDQLATLYVKWAALEDAAEADEDARTANEAARKDAEAARETAAAAAVASANNAAAAATEAAQRVPEVVTVAESELFVIKDYNGSTALYQVISE